jgi:polysaccharide export outer membrane protein
MADADTLAMDWSRVPEYRIVPGDLLNLNYGPSPEQPWRDVLREAKVRPDGRISVFPVGDVVAAGLTPRELETSLRDLLSAEYREPRVTVEVAELAGNKVHVLGRVKKPGSVEAEAFITVTQAVAEAGGFEDDAAANSILVFHRDGARTVRVTRVKLDETMNATGLSADVPLSRFDIVYVPRSTIGNIYVFTEQVFKPLYLVATTALVGWELFHLNRVIVTPVR